MEVSCGKEVWLRESQDEKLGIQLITLLRVQVCMSQCNLWQSSLATQNSRMISEMNIDRCRRWYVPILLEEQDPYECQKSHSIRRSWCLSVWCVMCQLNNLILTCLLYIYQVMTKGSGSETSGQERPRLSDDEIRDLISTHVALVFMEEILRIFRSTKTMQIDMFDERYVIVTNVVDVATTAIVTIIIPQGWSDAILGVR